MYIFKLKSKYIDKIGIILNIVLNSTFFHYHCIVIRIK